MHKIISSNFNVYRWCGNDEARYAEMEWRNRKDVEALREYLEDELVTWLDQHIKAMDTPMADFVSQFEKYKGY